MLTHLRERLLDAALHSLSVRRRRLLAWRAMPYAEIREVTFVRDGIVWTATGDDYITFNLFIDGHFEARDMVALLDWSRHFGILSGSRDTFIDVGAHIGTTCIPFVRRSHCRALAIEPAAENFRLLELNIRNNGLSERIRVANRAVLRTPGSHTMCLTGTAAGGNFVHRDPAIELPPTVTGRERVEAERLCSIIEAAGLSTKDVALVWSDVQGCESDVIESGAPLWEAGVPLFAEVEPISLDLQGNLATFTAAAGRHFDRFIPADDLAAERQNAVPQPIAELDRLIRGLQPPRITTNALFLPPGLRLPPE